MRRAEKWGFATNTQDHREEVMNKERTATSTAMGAALLQAMPDGRLPHPTVETALFKKEADFTIVVPDNWRHATAIGDFVTEFRSKTFACDSRVTDQNFAKVTYGLIPGGKYRVRIVGHTGATTSECIAYLAKLGGLLLGAQALALVASLRGHELLYKRPQTVVSFGEERGLPVGPDGERLVPFMSRSEFNLAPLGCAWPENYAMLVVTRIA